MEFQKIFGPQPKELDWYGIINFTLAVFLDCKWHKYKYSIRVCEKDEQAVWCSVTPEPEKPKAGEKPLEKPAEAKRVEEPPPDGEKPKKKIGWTKDPPPPPKKSVVDDFCFFSATRLMPTSARIKILDPLGNPAKTLWAEVTFLRWLQGYPPRIVFLRPSRVYGQYRFQDFSFWRPPPPPEPPRKRLRFRIAP
ncbi:hypothetical protein KC19_VG337600 [Ceratodon purpureus]|uniref:Uncharacterized protein n=1 Tax=Ceratodon purpureus TaxID=3225 RepID=A0A8T0HW36_CERPU|nr:hypothetical protein KC19_VG337600 [Ceratodon purpureus]